MPQRPERPSPGHGAEPYAALRDHPDVARLLGAAPSEVARRVNLVTDPSVTVSLALLVVAVASSSTWLAGLGWAALTWVFCVGLPFAWLLLLVRRGHVADRQLVVRQQRRGPLLVAMGCMLVGLGLVAWLGAPREVVAFVVAVLAAVLVMTVVTRRCKASFHVGAMAGSVVAVCQTVGWWWAPAAIPLLALCGWARVRAGRHTVGEVLLGLVLSATVTGIVDAITVRLP